MNFNKDHIELSRILSELIEKKTGEKKEFERGDWWLSKCVGNVSPRVYIDDFYADDIQWLHPLYLEGEVIEIIKNNRHIFRVEAVRWIDGAIMDAILSDDIRLALLKLAVEVMK